MQFGLYLKRKGVISAEQLVRALELQQKRLVPIGQLAIEEGVLSVRSVFKVLRCQGGLPHDRFGEIAVDMGLMTQDQLQRLLMLQLSRVTPLAEMLVQMKLLTPAQVDEELAAYRRQMERRNVVRKRRIAKATLGSVPSIVEQDTAEADETAETAKADYAATIS